jgi:hypothetical protein
MTQNFRVYLSHIALAILAAYSLYHGLRMVKGSARNFENPTSSDAVTTLDTRFAPLRAELSQRGCREVGYVTDSPDKDWFTGYSQTQYALAPILVDDSTRPALIVANLRDPSAVVSIMRNNHFLLISDYGNGLILLSRETR